MELGNKTAGQKRSSEPTRGSNQTKRKVLSAGAGLRGSNRTGLETETDDVDDNEQNDDQDHRIIFEGASNKGQTNVVQERRRTDTSVRRSRTRVIAENVVEFQKWANLGEVKTTRNSPRSASLENARELFEGVSRFDECTRLMISFCHIKCFHFTVKISFKFMIGKILKFNLVNNRDMINSWAAYECKIGCGKKKSQREFWETAFYDDRRDEYQRLKYSLVYPSRIFTFGALDSSWRGLRDRLGVEVGPRDEFTFQFAPKTRVFFGIVDAK